MRGWLYQPPPCFGMLYSLQTDKPVAHKYLYFPISVCVVGAGSGEMGKALTMRASPELAPFFFFLVVDQEALRAEAVWKRRDDLETTETET